MPKNPKCWRLESRILEIFKYPYPEIGVFPHVVIVSEFHEDPPAFALNGIPRQKAISASDSVVRNQKILFEILYPKLSCSHEHANYQVGSNNDHLKNLHSPNNPCLTGSHACSTQAYCVYSGYYRSEEEFLENDASMRGGFHGKHKKHQHQQNYFYSCYCYDDYIGDGFDCRLPSKK